jgi:hypothetical protein
VGNAVGFVDVGRLVGIFDGFKLGFKVGSNVVVVEVDVGLAVGKLATGDDVGGNDSEQMISHDSPLQEVISSNAPSSKLSEIKADDAVEKTHLGDDPTNPVENSASPST